MGRFIELHLNGKDDPSILINVDYISRIQNGKNEVIIYLGLKSDAGSDMVLHIKETYEEVKNLIDGL